MSYVGKTNWHYDDIVKESDLNRIEQGIMDAHSELESVKLEAKEYTDSQIHDVTPGQIGAASETEFDAHVNDAGLHVTAQKQQEWNNKANAVHQHSASDITSGIIASARLPAATTSTAGISKLDNTITSTSTTDAATAGAVKQVNEKFSNIIRINNGVIEVNNGSGWTPVMSSAIKSIQRGVVTLVSVPQDIKISAVNINKSVVHLSSLFGRSQQGTSYIVTYASTNAQLINSTTLQFTGKTGRPSDTLEYEFVKTPIAWQVVEYA